MHLPPDAAWIEHATSLDALSGSVITFPKLTRKNAPAVMGNLAAIAHEIKRLYDGEVGITPKHAKRRK